MSYMAPEELKALIQKVRRGTTNRDILVILDETERLLKDATPFDKAAWQRAYMREYRKGIRRNVR